MKTYILTVDEGYGEYVYAVFAESFRDAYEKIKNDEGLSVCNCRDYELANHTDIYGCTFVTFHADKYGCPSDCTLTELKESNEILCLGGYAE